MWKINKEKKTSKYYKENSTYTWEIPSLLIFWSHCMFSDCGNYLLANKIYSLLLLNAHKLSNGREWQRREEQRREEREGWGPFLGGRNAKEHRMPFRAGPLITPLFRFTWCGGGGGRREVSCWLPYPHPHSTDHHLFL